MTNETIKTLRFKLETPMVSDDKVTKEYDVDCMKKGSHIPDYTYVEKSRMADVVRTMLKYSTSFNLSNDQSDVSYDYFVEGLEMKDIAEKRNMKQDTVKRLILRLKNKAYKLLNNQVKQSDLDRLSKDYTFISDTSL